MQRTIIPSQNVGRWLDFEHLEFERHARSHGDTPGWRVLREEERSERGAAPCLTYRPFERLTLSRARPRV